MEREIAEQAPSAKRPRDAFRGDEVVCLPPACREVDLDPAVGATAALGLRELSDLVVRFLDARGGLRAAGGRASTKPVDLAPDGIGQRATLDILGLEECFAPLEEVAVVPLAGEVPAGVPRVDLNDPIRDPLEEVPIVRRDDERDLLALEELLEPIDALEVEMVRRLVHEEQIGLLNELASDGEPLLPAAGEPRGNRGIVLESQAAKHLSHADRTLVVLHREVGQRSEQSLFNRAPFGECVNLRQVRDASSLGPLDRTSVRRLEACQDPQKCGLPGAVRPDQPDALARVEGKRKPRKQACETRTSSRDPVPQ